MSMEAPPIETKWIRPGKAARIMCIARSTLCEMRKNGKIRFSVKASSGNIPLYLYDASHVEELRPKP